MKTLNWLRAMAAFCVLGLSLHVLPAHGKPLNVLVWDAYFAPADLPLQQPGMGQLGEEFDWDPQFLSHFSGKAMPKEHGKMVAYILLKDMPNVVLHRLHDAFLPWEDPELCDLTSDGVFSAELQKQGYAPLPNCREPMQKRVKELIAFIHQHDIKIVNMSHGVYFDRYTMRNPDLLRARFPKVDTSVLHKFLYVNFLSDADLLAPLFAENPGTLFVAAAGNNSANLDNPIYPMWEAAQPSGNKYFAPTLFASFSERFDNVVSVASSSDGADLDEVSNWGKNGVDFVKQVGAFKVPSTKGSTGWQLFTDTSAAAAETSRLYIQAYLAYGDKLALSPQLLKKMSLAVATPVEAFKDKVLAGGVLQDADLLNALAEPTRRPQSESSQSEVIAKQGNFTEFHLPADLHTANHQMGCHSLAVDGQNRIWITLPWANLIVSFDPLTKVFTRFPLGEGVKSPDGITIDPQGRVWAGVDQPGGFVMIDPRQQPAPVQVFAAPQGRTGNITTADPSGVIWATSHQARRLLRFDPRTNQFAEFPVATDWPLDVRADHTGAVWVAGMENLNGGGGPGALARFDGKTGDADYTPIMEGADRMVEWLAPSNNWVMMTSGSAGIYLFDRTTSAMTRISRADGRQYYWIVRTPDENGSVFVLANGYEGAASLDVLDVHHPERIVSYALPNPKGPVREALDFDKAGNAWFCAYGTDVIGRLELPSDNLAL